MVHGEDVVEDRVEVVDEAHCWLFHLDHVVGLLFHVGHGEDGDEDLAEVDLEDLGLVDGHHAHGGHGDPLGDDLVVGLGLVEDSHLDEHGDGFLRA